MIADGALYVYSIDHGNRLVQTVSLPSIGTSIHGVVASPRTGRLYIAYGQQKPPGGSLLAYDLRRGRVLWHRTYPFGIDSMAISPNGRWIYMPAGEGTTDGRWRIIAAAERRAPPAGRSKARSGRTTRSWGRAAGTCTSAASTTRISRWRAPHTNQVVRKLGPLNGPGVRPFTINGSQTLAFTTARSFLGFQVSSITTGKVLYTVPVPGFSFDPATFGRTPDHGIALSPERAPALSDRHPERIRPRLRRPGPARRRRPGCWRTSSSCMHRRTTAGSRPAETDATSTSGALAT